MYKLYKTTNLGNGVSKLTLGEPLSIQVGHSKYPIQFTVNEYGLDNFSIDLLEESTDRKYISDLEEPTIIKHNNRLDTNI